MEPSTKQSTVPAENPNAEALYSVGDVVCFTNEYGVKWHGRRVVEVDEYAAGERRYFLEPSDSP